MTTERDLERLRHIVDACDRTRRYTSAGRASLNGEIVYDSVLRCLTAIGKALGALSDGSYAAPPSVPPGLPKAQRSLIVHEYWTVDPDVVWATVTGSLPALRSDAVALLARLGPRA